MAAALLPWCGRGRILVNGGLFFFVVFFVVAVSGEDFDKSLGVTGGVFSAYFSDFFGVVGSGWFPGDA